MLFSPEAHESLVGEAWSAERVRTAIAAVVADAEEAFYDGWPIHPQDREVGDDAARRFRTMYLGGAGVVAALHRLALRGFVGLRRDYVPYLEMSLEGEPDFPDADGQRSLWMGEVGIRLVLQRLAPSAANLEQLARLIAANERDERRELMWGSPGTILAGRELGLDTSASEEWLRGQRDDDGLWTQHLYGEDRRLLGPAHGFAGCVLALGDTHDVAETLQRQAVVENGLANWPPVAGQPLDAARDRQIRVQWCHGAPGIVATLAHLLDEEAAVAGGELIWRAGPLRKGQTSATARLATATRSSRCTGGPVTSAGSSGRAPSRCTPWHKWSRRGRNTAADATPSGRATSAPPTTSPTASTATAGHRFPSQ